MGRSAIVFPQPPAPSRRRVIQEGLVAWSTGKSMRCQNCSAENPQNAKFCIQCATAFSHRCQKCGFENPSEKNGLSFRYPSSMQVEERDPPSFGYGKSLAPDVIVDLQILGSKGSTVMRFICASGVQTPRMAAVKIRSFRETAREAQDGSSMSMQIDGQAIATGAELGTRNITSTTRGGTMLAQRL
jgi:hypothetical protein